MRHFVDLEELNLLELLDMQSQAVLGLINLDDENFDLLCIQVAARDELVCLLEKCLSLPDAETKAPKTA
jgi:hypothetical protein